MKTPITPALTLEEVSEQFNQWRGNKKRGERIPQRLWSAAIGLLSRYPITRISRTLRLSSADLRKHQGALAAGAGRMDSHSQVSFVEIEAAVVDQAVHSSTPSVSLELERGDGMRLRIQGAHGADIVAVIERFMGV